MDSETHISKMDEAMRLSCHADTTKESYRSCLKRYLAYFKNVDHPKNINEEEARGYFDTIVQQSPYLFKQHLCAVRFFYHHCVGQPRKFDKIPYPDLPRTLPEIISKERMDAIVTSTMNLQDKTILSTFWSTGMRLRELCTLRIDDIKSDRMVILIRDGKGDKQRDVPLVPELLDLHREYWKTHKSKLWVFPGERAGNYISPATVYRKVEDLTGTHPHVIRHSFATAMMEQGVPMPMIQAILGHSNIKTTMRYTHVSSKMFENIWNPLKKAA